MHISPSNKYYIGITSMKPVKKRFANGKGYSRNIYFTRAINKYGWNNFQHIIYKENLSEKEAKELEISLIAKYKSNKREFGYNITSGGDGTSGVPKTQHQIDMIKLASSVPVYQFDMNYQFLNEFPSVREAARQLNIPSKSGIRDCCVGRLQSSGGYIWRYKKDVSNPFDKNTIKKSEYKYNTTPLYRIDLLSREYTLYSSIKDACEQTGFTYEYIFNCCKGRSKSYKGYLWVFAKDIDIISFINNDSNFKIGRCKQISQYDENGNLINQFVSASSAGNQLKINHKRIVAACNGEIPNYKGFIWKYI